MLSAGQAGAEGQQGPAGAKFGRKRLRSVVEMLAGGVLTKLIDIGCQTGLFEASVEGAATSDELAARAGLDERYVRE